MRWPGCTVPNCHHAMSWESWPPTPDQEHEARERYLVNGHCVCVCHGDIEPPGGKERVPCDESSVVPPSAEELAEVYKSLGVQEP